MKLAETGWNWLELASQTAVWYHWGKPPVPIRWVLIRDPRGQLDTQAPLCTNPTVAPAQMVEWFVLRRQLEATSQELRAHLGVEIQRQWSDRAIARTTPILMGLFSWVALAAHALQKRRPIIQRTAAWYAKPAPHSSMPLPWCIACPSHRLTCPPRLNVQTPILCVVHWLQGTGDGFPAYSPRGMNRSSPSLSPD